MVSKSSFPFAFTINPPPPWSMCGRYASYWNAFLSHKAKADRNVQKEICVALREVRNLPEIARKPNFESQSRKIGCCVKFPRTLLALKRTKMRSEHSDIVGFPIDIDIVLN